MRFRAALSIIGMIAGLAVLPAAAAPAFNCAKASSEDEFAICADAGLSALDRKLDRIWKRLPASRRAQQKSAQRAWVSQRKACGGDVGCIAGMYDSRIAELSGGGGGATNTGGGPSFSCGAAGLSADELAVCGDDTLSTLDRRLNALYKNLDSRRKAREKSAQRDWLAERAGCGDDISCLEQTYRQRIAALKQADIVVVEPESEIDPPPPPEVKPEKKKEDDLTRIRRAAEGGDPWAQAILAEMYETGRGVAADEDEALRLYELSAIQPDAPDWARTNLTALKRKRAGNTDVAPPKDIVSEPVVKLKDAVTLLDPNTGPAVNAIKGGTRVALVIGNGKYVHASPLPNPPNDSRAMAELLRAMGFSVIEGSDLDKLAMEAKMQEFAQAAQRADIALFFYAGHGIQVAGENYLIPVGASLTNETSLKFEVLNVRAVTDFMGGDNRVGIILLDACRDNPFADKLKRSMKVTRSTEVGRGLAPLSAAGGGLFVVFATAPDDVAADGENSKNSPFTTALLKHLPTKGLEVNTVMTRVKADVSHMTKQDQRPWTNSDLTSEVYLVSGE